MPCEMVNSRKKSGPRPQRALHPLARRNRGPPWRLRRPHPHRSRCTAAGLKGPISVQELAGAHAGFTSLEVFADWQLVNAFLSRQSEARWIVIDHRRCRGRSIVLAESDAGWACHACENALASDARRRTDVGLVYDSALDPMVKIVPVAHQRLGFQLYGRYPVRSGVENLIGR